MSGIPAGRLSIEIVAEVARLQADLDRCKSAVKAASGDIAASARAANDNLRNIGNGAGAGLQQFSREVAALKGRLDPTFAALQSYKQQVALLQKALAEGAISHKQFVEQMRVAVGVYKGAGSEMVRTSGAGRMLGQQLSQVAQQAAAGTNVLQALAIQLPDIAVGMGAAGGEAKGFAGFLGGPWGIAITSAIAVLVPLVSKLWEAGEAADSSAKKIRSFATAADLAQQSTEVVKMTASLGELQAQYARMAGPSRQSQAFFANTVQGKDLAQQIALKKADIETTRNIIGLRDKQIRQIEAVDAGVKAAALAEREHKKDLRESAKAAREAAAAQKEYEKSLMGRVQSGTFLGQFATEMDKHPIVDIGEIFKGADLSGVMKEIEAIQEGVQRLKDADTFMADYTDKLRLSAELANSLGDSLSKAFGRGGAALGDMVKILGTYGDRQSEIEKSGKSAAERQKLSSDLQLTSLIDLTGAAKGLFKEHSAGYKAMEAAEKALTIVQIARTAVAVAEGAANMFAAAGPGGFPLVAAMLGVMASLGFAGGGGGGSAPKYNDGKGTVFGDSDAKSDSIKRSLDLLGDIDTDMLAVSRQMAASLKNIESQIGGVTNLVLRNGLDNVEGKMGIKTGFNSALPGFMTSGAALGAAVGGFLIAGPIGAAIGAIASKIPILGDILGGIGKLVGSLFGTKTKVVGSGIFGGPQSFGDIEDLGFAGQTFVDIKRTKKFLGVSTGSKYKTKYGDLDDGLEQQFGLLLTSFGDAIKLAAGPLGLDLDTITAKLDSFVVDIGKIDLKGLTGDEIQEKLEAVFGAQADKMAQFAIAGLEKFQKVGEGYFETMIRVASTVEAVTSSLQLLGLSAQSLGLDASMAIAGFFDSVSDYQSAAGAYFETYYSEAEQTAAKTAALGKVFASLGVAMPDSIAGFRALVEAQDLGTAAGQQLYAQLLQIAPAFAEVANAGRSAASAAAILRERQDLQKQIWELEGNTAAIRKAEIDALDPSNRALLERIYALKDQAAAEAAAEQRRAEAAQRAQEAAQRAKELADAWRSAGNAIMDEVRRIRGELVTGAQSYAALQQQFQTATGAARGGNIDAARSLPEISKALIDAAAASATDDVMLRRIKAVTAASLEQTYATIGKKIPGFASGGEHDGGLRLVGENGPELEATGPSRIWNAEQLVAAMSGGAETAAEIKALRAEIKDQNYQIAKSNAQIRDLLRRWDGDGMPAERAA